MDKITFLLWFQKKCPWKNRIEFCPVCTCQPQYYNVRASPFFSHGSTGSQYGNTMVFHKTPAAPTPSLLSLWNLLKQSLKNTMLQYIRIRGGRTFFFFWINLFCFFLCEFCKEMRRVRGGRTISANFGPWMDTG